MYSRITCNSGAVRPRYEELDGRKHIICPTVMFTEGVHNGSKGPLYYSIPEITKNPDLWNHKPVVRDHPVLNGQGISAATKEVIDTSRLGILLNTQTDNRLKTEAWCDYDKTKRVAPDILANLEQGIAVEGSTGILHDLDSTEGIWNGERYVGSVCNIKPDHYAILSKDKGACSLADGGGVLMNSDTVEGVSYKDIRDQASTSLNSNSPEYHYVADIFPKHIIYEKAGKMYKAGYTLKSGKVKLATDLHTEVRKQTSYVTCNHQVTQALIGHLKERLIGAHVLETTDSSITWNQENEIFRLPFTKTEDKIIFIGEPEHLTIKYDPKLTSEGTMTQKLNTNNSPPANVGVTDPAPSPAGGQHSDGQARPSIVDRLISSGGPWTEADREFLTALGGDKLSKIQGTASTGATQVITPYLPGAVGDRSNAPGHSPTGNNGVTMSWEQERASLSPRMRAIVDHGAAALEAERNGVIQTILSNANNPFTKEYLDTIQDIGMLKGMAALGAPAQQQLPTTNYGGPNGVPVQMFKTPTTNAAPQTPQKPLTTMGYQELLK